jgi:hypothetical protein
VSHVLALPLLAVSVLVPAGAAEQSAFEVALAEARRNAQRPGGQAFETVVGKEFGATYGPKLSGCAKQVKKPDLRDFDVLVRLSLNGRVEEALVRPETNLAMCLRDQLKEVRLQAPESAGYWVRIGLKLKQ